MTPLLEVRDIAKRLGGVVALDGVSFCLSPGEVVGLIGPNGAGKTTLVNVVSGVYRPDAGSILLNGKQIDGMRADKIVREGVARSFQVVQPFPRMSVFENVEAAALFGGRAASRAEARRIVLECLDFCDLTPFRDKLASTLPLAGRKRLELAKSLALDPKVLLLDEVNAGLNATEIGRALALISSIANRGIAILLIEHLMKIVTQACSRILVLHNGRLIADGPAANVMRDEKVIAAYLGRRYSNGKEASP